MFRNYFKSALRNFWKNKVITVITVLGLAIGISASLVIYLMVHYEYSFDRFEKDSNRIYRVVMDIQMGGIDGHSAAVPSPLGTAVRNDLTGIDLTVPVFSFPGDGKAKVTISKNNSTKATIYKDQPDVIFTNGNYFQLLPYHWIAGSAANALNSPYSIVLTKSRAMQYFPNSPMENIIGKQIIYNDNFHHDINVTVTGIVNDLTKPTSFTGKEFISFATIDKTNLGEQFMMNTWNDWMAYSQLYLKLSNGINAALTEKTLNNLFNKYNIAAKKNPFQKINLRLQPLNDIHYNKEYQGFNQTIVTKSSLYGLLLIAGFLLLLGCINFINLSTAQSMQRIKEVGIRKIIGGSKKQLTLQFLSETFLITIVATLLSVALIPLLLNLFSRFIPEGIHFDLLKQPFLWIFLIAIIILVSLISGFYPAVILSAYNPLRALKNQSGGYSGEMRTIRVRRTLIVSQFVVAQFFIIATIAVSRQIHFALNKDLGFKQNGILTFNSPPTDTIASHRTVLLNEIKTIPGVQMASIGFVPPAEDGGSFSNIKYNDGKQDIQTLAQIRWGDTNFLKLYGIKLLAGRNIEQSDTVKEFIINQTYAKILGFNNPSDAINKRLEFNGKSMPIVGVMNDFNAQSLHSKIRPVVFTCFNNASYTYHISLKPQNVAGTLWRSTITQLRKDYKKMYPQEEFNYTFLDKTIAKFYQSEENISLLLRWATGIAIFISCLGLLGLVIFATGLRTKEIGIRKILGASVVQITVLLSKDFIKLVLIAFLIAAPVTWWAAYKWLENFAYKTAMSWWIFVISGLIMIILALITLSVQTIRTAMANPVKALKTE